MKNAIVDFKQNIAFSTEFDDIYFNTHKPWEESEYVFASGIDEIWHTKDSFIVAEAGFGAGLNFLTLCNRFKNSDKKLHYVSIEAYPIRIGDLRQIYARLGIYKALSKKLFDVYPLLVSGIHRIEFAPNITLDLCFGEISQMLDELDFNADLWFMDGFAPSKNEAMWSEEVFKKVASLSKIGTILRTYSCAKIVRQNLPSAGFKLELRKGYGKKREMSHAVLEKERLITKDIWYQRQRYKYIKDVLVVGGGVAGLVCAYELKRAGLNVIIAEKRADIALNGSGNHCGILMPLITKPDVNLGKMHLNAFLQAVRTYKNVMSKQEVSFDGVSEYAFNEMTLLRMLSHGKNEIFSLDLNAKPYPKANIFLGATARPRMMCKRLANGLNVLLNHEYKSHKHLKNGKISVKFQNKTIIKTDALIFATGSESVDIFKTLPISFVRGQVTHIRPTIDNLQPISSEGYITPARDNIQVIGATYARNEYDDNQRALDDIENLNNIKQFIDTNKVEIIGYKVGYRSYSSDRFPIISAFHDDEYYEQNYKNLFWTKKKNDNVAPKYHKNIFLNIAHGSRGLCTAVLGAKILTDLILNRPLCIEKSLFNELHSARFLIRKLKKGLK